MTPTDSPALRDALWRAVASVRQGTALMFKGDADLIEAFLTTQPAEQADAEDAARYRWLRRCALQGVPAWARDLPKPRNDAEFDAAVQTCIAADAGLRATQQPNDGGEGCGG